MPTYKAGSVTTGPVTTTRLQLDTDTEQHGIDGPFKPWESDHTALVHVLWDCAHDGLTLRGDFDDIASRIMRSRWMAAVKDKVRQESDQC